MIPVQVKKAFIAAEDARFYEHPGFDWQGVVRAACMVAKRPRALARSRNRLRATASSARRKATRASFPNCF